MTKRTQIFIKNKLIAMGEMQSYTLPRAPISKIIISGVETTACATALTVNELFEWIKIRINGKEFIDIGGESEASKVPYGIALWREFYKQKHNGVAMPNNQWIIELPDALPIDAQIDLIYKIKTEAHSKCSDSALVYHIDIIYELDDKIKGKVIVPFVMCQRVNFGAGVGHQYHYVPALPYKLRTVVMLSEDSGTIEATLGDDINDLTIKSPLKTFFDGMTNDLKLLHESKSGVALTAGYFMYSFKGGIKVAPNTLLFDFFVDTAGTDTSIHFLYICY